jgi:hypothetical protein
MTKDELITKQQLEIENLKDLLKDVGLSVKYMHRNLYAIGAPLNDNCIGLNEEQVIYFGDRLGNPIHGLIHDLRDYIEW